MRYEGKKRCDGPASASALDWKVTKAKPRISLFVKVELSSRPCFGRVEQARMRTNLVWGSLMTWALVICQIAPSLACRQPNAM